MKHTAKTEHVLEFDNPTEQFLFADIMVDRLLFTRYTQDGSAGHVGAMYFYGFKLRKDGTPGKSRGTYGASGSDVLAALPSELYASMRDEGWVKAGDFQ